MMHNSISGIWSAIRWCVLAGLLLLLMVTLTGAPQLAHATDGTVTNCAAFHDGGPADTLGELLPGGGTITFACDGAITLPAGTQIVINMLTTLDGNGHMVTILGNGNRVFQVNSGVELMLIDMVVSGGSISGNHGGGIYNSGFLHLINSTIYDNSSNQYGGGIYNTGEVYLTDSTVSGNTATGNGGGIANYTGMLYVTNSMLISNSSNSNGGGIYNYAGSVTLTGSGTIVGGGRSTEANTAGSGAGIYTTTGTLRVEGGAAISGNTATSAGGGIYIGGSSNVTITGSGTIVGGDVLAEGNKAQNGGGIYNANPATTIENGAAVSFNATTQEVGGGIYNVGTFIVNRTTISNNSAITEGGGIYNEDTLLITSSTFANNRAEVGGGIRNNSSLQLTNSTLSGNSAILQAGGISNFEGTATIINSTFTDNTADPTFGGAIKTVGGSVTMTNTIVANSPSGGNCSGTIINGGHNLSSDGTCGFNLINTDPKLAPLANNGGPTKTHMLIEGSPAIDAGDNAVCANAATVNNLDQRGEPRPVDGNGDGTPACDMGAVEGVVALPTLRINNGAGFESNTAKITFTVTRTGPTDATSTVQYATADGTGESCCDYVAANGTLTFGPGVTTRPIVIRLRGDVVVDGTETFFVNLSNPTNASITDNQGQGTIADSTTTLRTPTNGAYLIDNTPTLSWTRVGQAAEYHLEIRNAAGVVVNQFLTAITYTHTTAFADGPYAWRIQTRDAANNWGNWTDVHSFVIDTTPPARPGLISPANGASITDNTPLFQWRKVGQAIRYTLQVDDNADFSSPVINEVVVSPDYTPTKQLADKRYYWRVRARDLADRWSPWSARWSFVVNAVPFAPPTSTPTLTATPTLTPIPTGTPVPTDTLLPTSTSVPTGTQVPTEMPTETPVPSATPTGIPTETPTEVPTATPTETPTETLTATPTETPTEVPTATPTEDVPTPEATEEPAS